MNASLLSLLSDTAIISILLLIGVFCRSRFQWIQKLFLPASIIAGLLALLLGPNGLSWIPLTSNIAQYPGILVTFIFASLALNTGKISISTVTSHAGSMWSYGTISMVGMYGIGVLITLVLLQQFWPAIPDGFGILLAAGFIGGHGTAAAIGGVFVENGWPEATSLAMTAATVGVLASIIGGVFIIRQNVKQGNSNFISSFEELPVELRTGLIPEEKRSKTAVETVSSMTIDPLLFHALLVITVSGGSFWIQSAIRSIFDFSVPTFALAFLFGIIVNVCLSVCNAKAYVNPTVLNNIGGASTDLLVVFGIASINLTVAGEYFVPLSLMMVFGVIFSYLMLKYMAPRFYSTYSFEKSIFGWGWSTGTVAMGIALLRIVDPKMKSKTLDEFGFAYVLSAPIEIMIVTFSPLILLSGGGWFYVLGSIVMCAVMFLMAKVFGWYRSK